MTSPASKMLLYIQPTGQKTDEPVNDGLTAKMAAAFANYKTGVLGPTGFMEGGLYRGFHRCVCGEYSSTEDYLLPSGFVTNSLCIHYLRWHRNEVPQSELDKVASLLDEPIEQP